MRSAPRSWVIPAAALIGLLLSGMLDVPLSGLFYRPGEGFFLDRTWPVQLLYRVTPWLIGSVATALIAALAWGILAHARRVRLAAAYALLALILGPGLLVNGVLKEWWGRPRPEQIAAFGGTASFVPPLWPSRQCNHNCSFVSGHAAAGFYLITGAWIWPRRRRAWRIAGISAGGLIGQARIAQGGHFLSDVLGALIVVWLTDEVLYRWMLERGWLGDAGHEESGQ
jgi:lipid A 4'-phosphatase